MRVEEGGRIIAGNERIIVSVRLRPLNSKEIESNDFGDWECNSNNNSTIFFNNCFGERSIYPNAYTFDRVFGFDCSTKQVYEEEAKGVVLSVLYGINSSVFAYGQTSSGKTYTMRGITQHAIHDIYDYVEQRNEREFVLKFSAMEIYNEHVRDLLSLDTAPLRLMDDPERGTVVERLTKETVTNKNHLLELIAVCESQRQVGETSLNETSSRSHQIIKLLKRRLAREQIWRSGYTMHQRGARETPEQILDPKLSTISFAWRKEMLTVLKIALHCTDSTAARRPSMKKVVEMLKEINQK